MGKKLGRFDQNQGRRILSALQYCVVELGIATDLPIDKIRNT